MNCRTQFRLKPIAIICLHAVLALSVTTLVARADEIKSEPVAAMEAGMDKSVLPGDDFYRYVNGGWEKTAVIPGDKSSIGNTSTLRD